MELTKQELGNLKKHLYKSYMSDWNYFAKKNHHIKIEKRKEKILSFCETPKKIAEIYKIFGWACNRTIRRYLRKMVEEGELESKHDGNVGRGRVFVKYYES